MLGKGLLEFVPLRVVRWIVRRTGEVHWAHIVSGLSVVPTDIIEERKSCKNAECEDEVENELPVSHWDGGRLAGNGW